MPRRRRSVHDLSKAHDWEPYERKAVAWDGASFVQTVWRCTKCGTVLDWQSKKPDRYTRFEVFRGNFVQKQSGMLCDEVITFKVMET